MTTGARAVPARPPRIILFLLIAAAACATPESRIKRHKAAFDAYPAEVQERIRAGQVDVGFTREQVELALGRPDRKYARQTAAAAQDVWAYGAGSVRPSLSLGFGMGSGGGGFYGGGLGVGSKAGREDRARVVFQDGAVVSVERLLQ